MATVRKYTEEQIKEYRRQLGQLTNEELEAIPCKRTGTSGTANDWLIKCGVRYFERDGETLGVYKIRATEAKELLHSIAREARVIASLPADMPTDIEPDTVKILRTDDIEALAAFAIDQLKALRMDKEGNVLPYTEGCESVVALSVAQSIMKESPDYLLPTSDGLGERVSRYSHRLNMRTEVMKLVQKWAEEQLAGETPMGARYAATIEPFRRYLYQAFAADSMEKKTIAKERVQERNEGRVDVRINGLRNWAQSVASSFSQSKPASQWKEVVLALVFLTGRRPYSEVMSTAQFTVIDKSTVRFLGQAKGRGTKADDFALDIPVFADATKVTEMLQWLENNGRKVSGELRRKEETNGKLSTDEDARKLAHRRWSKELSEYFRDVVKPLIDIEGDLPPQKEISPHSLRALYAKEYGRVYHPNSQFISLDLSTVLGHSDSGTTARYEIDFNVID